MFQLYKNYRPARFFGTLCLILLLLAAGGMIPVFIEYIETGLVPKFPTLIVCGFVALAGIQSFFSGMILEVLAAKDRRDFEYRFVKISGEKRDKEESEAE